MTALTTNPAGMIGALAARRDDAQAKARARYRELLTTGSESPADVAALEEAAGLIGKSPEQIAKDVAALQQAARLRDTIERGDIPQAEHSAAAEALAQHQEDTRRIREERQREFANLLNQQNQLGARVEDGRQAAQQLAALTSLHPDVL